MPQLKLTYFDAPGRAEPIRVALHLAGIDFEDHRISYSEFAALKSSGALPLGSVPVLELDGVAIVQTAAILRYAANASSAGLYPSDPVRALVVDSVLDSFNDTLSSALLPSLYERDMTKKLAMRAEWVAGPMQRVLAYTEALLGRFGGPFVGGRSLSIADLVVAQQLLQIRSGGLDGVSADVLAPYPLLNALTEAYLADPRVQAYRAR